MFTVRTMYILQADCIHFKHTVCTLCILYAYCMHTIYTYTYIVYIIIAYYVHTITHTVCTMSTYMCFISISIRVLCAYYVQTFNYNFMCIICVYYVHPVYILFSTCLGTICVLCALAYSYYMVTTRILCPHQTYTMYICMYTTCVLCGYYAYLVHPLYILYLYYVHYYMYAMCAIYHYAHTLSHKTCLLYAYCVCTMIILYIRYSTIRIRCTYYNVYLQAYIVNPMCILCVRHMCMYILYISICVCMPM